MERDRPPPLETLIREYRRTREYERDSRSRRREGWRAVSVLQRPAQPGRARQAAMRVGLAHPETEYLVTYNRAPGGRPHQRPLDWLWETRLGRARSRGWLWLVVAVLLVTLLAVGFFDFFADAIPF